MIKKCLSVTFRKLRAALAFLQLKTGFYRRETLPEYDLNYLLTRWPYRDPECVREGSTRAYTNDLDLSICIPMFNVEDSILRLLKQIEKQETHFSYEVLLVDDGSTDQTANIAMQFITGKKNYQVFTQVNAGLSAARNVAIDNASGKYLTFLDSDDEICDGFIESLMNVAVEQNADIVKGRYYLKRDGHLYPKGIVPGYIWGCVFRERLFTKIRFPLGYWYEDMINLFLLSPLANKIETIDIPVICHNDTEGSLSKIQSSSRDYKVIEHLYLVMYLTKTYKILGLKDIDYLHKRLLAECSGLMARRTKRLDVETRKQVFLACNKLFLEEELKADHYKGIERIFVNAIMEKDYTAWDLAAKVY